MEFFRNPIVGEYYITLNLEIFSVSVASQNYLNNDENREIEKNIREFKEEKILINEV